MTIIPIRGVGDFGIIPDRISANLPINAWSDGRNVRFADGEVSRSSAFKVIMGDFGSKLGDATCLFRGSSTEDGHLVTINPGGAWRSIVNGVSTASIPVGGAVPGENQVTVSNLGSLVWVGVEGAAPAYRAKPADGLFTLDPQWPANNTFVSLRSYKDFLVALNITKSAVNYPNMVKWSNAVQNGAPPADWNVALDSSLAGETILNDVNGKLVDGLALGPSFVLYGTEDVYRMDYIGEPLVFQFEKMFSGRGIMAKNCAVEIEGRHYVFGTHDIFVHDGISHQSITDRRVRDYVYGRIDMTAAFRAFVFHNPLENEVGFCYPSVGDNTFSSPLNPPACNEAAVFNYKNNTWSFIDLPRVTAVTYSVEPTTVTWADMANWNQMSSQWSVLGGKRFSMPVFLSRGGYNEPGPTYRRSILFLDRYEDGFVTNQPLNNFEPVSYVTASHKDFDDLGISLKDRKRLNGIYPQIIASNTDGVVKVSLGATDNPNVDISWSDPSDFYPWSDYKIDCRTDGRLLGVRFELPSAMGATLTGYDIDINVIAGR